MNQSTSTRHRLFLTLPRYMAPEVHSKQKDYGTGVDIYSVGMIMWMMCTGKRPWESIGANEVADQVRRQWGSTSADVANLCWLPVCRTRYFTSGF